MSLRNFFRRDKFNAEMAEEMRRHVELQAELNVRSGMSPEEAHYAAQRQFGNGASIQEQAREQRGWIWLEHWTRALRLGGRPLIRSPGFIFPVVLTLMLGIGPNTAV